MNKERRKQIKEAINKINKIEEFVQNILDEEQESYDNMPESLQMSENGVISEEAQGNLETAISLLQEAVDCLEEIE